jgi:hypothetical protein
MEIAIRYLSATMSPLSLTNLQVAIGGQNVLNSTPNLTYENFLESVNLAEQLTSRTSKFSGTMNP